MQTSTRAEWVSPSPDLPACSSTEGAWLARRVTLDPPHLGGVGGDVLVPVPDADTLPTRADVQAALDALPDGHPMSGTVLPAPTLSRLAFLLRLTADERVAVRQSDDPYVADFRELLALSENVDVTHPATVQGVGYLEHCGLLAPGRASAILSTD